MHKSQPNSQTQKNFNSHYTKVPQIQDTFIKHMMYQIVEKPRHTKYLSMIQTYQKMSILIYNSKHSP